MHFIKTFCFVVFLGFIAVQGLAQMDSTKGHYLYKPKPFSPPVQAMINQFEGFPCTPVEAPDLEGKKHTLGGYKGKVTLLFFWRATPGEGDYLFDQLNNIATKYPKKVKVLALADDPKTTVVNYLEPYSVKFPVIANAKMLSEAVYGSELGYPRIFIIDEFGIIKRVLPQVVLTEGINLDEMLTLFF